MCSGNHQFLKTKYKYKKLVNKKQYTMPAECIMAIIMVCIKVLNMFFLLHLIIINPIKLNHN